MVVPAREIPVLAECDVLVCGGGAAGCAAAIAAARHGAEVVLLEKQGCLGGATVSRHAARVLSTNGVDFQGIWHEWMRALKRRGGVSARAANLPANGGFGAPIRCGVDPEVVKHVWDDMMAEAGARPLFHVWCGRAIVVDGVCAGVVVNAKEGRRAILAKRVVDCTADGGVCASAGAGWELGDAADHGGQELTAAFRLGGVDWPKGGYPQEYVEELLRISREVVARGEFSSPLIADGRVARCATDSGVHDGVVEYRNEMYLFPGFVRTVDTADPDDLTRAEREGRALAWECAEFIRRYIAGYEHSYLLDTGTPVVVGESRRVHGRAVATDADALELRRHPDGVARSSWKIGVRPDDLWRARIRRGEWFDIRYGSLVADKVENLLVAGSCLSAERKAQASLRIQQTCQSTGQAAGVAAALSLDAGVPPASLDVPTLLRALERDRDVEPAFPEPSP